MQNLNLSKQKFLLKIQKLNLKMLKLKKPRKYLRKFSWIDAQKKPCNCPRFFHTNLLFAFLEKRIWPLQLFDLGNIILE